MDDESRRIESLRSRTRGRRGASRPTFAATTAALATLALAVSPARGAEPACAEPCGAEQACCAADEECEDGRCVRQSLEGVWRDEAAGRQVRVVESGSEVTASYLTERLCDHRNGTGSSSTLFDFSGDLVDDEILGEIDTCKYGSSDAGWVRAPLKLTVAGDRRSLSGEWFNGVENEWIPIRFTRLADGADCTGYSGEITCDCDGDGQYEATQALETCGPEVPGWPTSFQSKCEDWVNPDGSYGYGTHPYLQDQGRAYLGGLACPSLACERSYRPCKRDADGRYEKCLFKRDFLGWRERCLRNVNEAIEECRQERERCRAAIGD
jgi:hypothetical protein